MNARECIRAIVLAGGEGTRSRLITGERSKPVVPVAHLKKRRSGS